MKGGVQEVLLGFLARRLQALLVGGSDPKARAGKAGQRREATGRARRREVPGRAGGARAAGRGPRVGGGPGAGASGGRLPPRSRTGGRQSGVRQFGASGIFLRSSRSPQVTLGRAGSSLAGPRGPSGGAPCPPRRRGESGSGRARSARFSGGASGLGPGGRAGPAWAGAREVEGPRRRSPASLSPDRAAAALPLGKLSPGSQTLFKWPRGARPARAGPLGCLLGRNLRVGPGTGRFGNGVFRGSDCGLWFPWSPPPAPELARSAGRDVAGPARPHAASPARASERESS